MDDFDDYDREAELALYKEYRDVVSQFQFVVETERRFYLANDVTQVVRERGNDFYFELTLNDVWVWDIYRSDRFVSSVKVLTFKDVNVEEARQERTEAAERSRPRRIIAVHNLGTQRKSHGGQFFAYAVSRHTENAGVTNSRNIPDSDDVWWKVAWATIATPGDRIVWQAIETFGARQAAGQMWTGHSRNRILELAHALDVSPGDIVAFRRRYPHPPKKPASDTVRQLTRELGLSLLHPGGGNWPERLLDLGPFQPIVLFARGVGDFLRTMPTIGVVGSRSPSAGGRAECYALTRDAIGFGYALISGGARGIDWVAHEHAASVRAPQVMVLATASDRPGSWQSAMVHRVAATGLVITETPPGHPITARSFLHRNRVIAALSDRVVVVEAAERSGSLNTASHAKTLGRDLSAVISRAKDDKNAGCYRLVDEWGADRYNPRPNNRALGSR